MPVVMIVRCRHIARGSEGKKRGLIAASEFGSARAFIYPIGLFFGRKPHHEVSALGAHASPRPGEAPFVEKSRLQRDDIVAVAVQGGLDAVQIGRVRRHRYPCLDVTRDDLANRLLRDLAECICL